MGVDDAPMALEQVDVVELESFEGGLDGLEDVLWASAGYRTGVRPLYGVLPARVGSGLGVSVHGMKE